MPNQSSLTQLRDGHEAIRFHRPNLVCDTASRYHTQESRTTPEFSEDAKHPERCLLVVSFIFPFPVDSGGARDIFNRLRALHRAGYKVDLIATVREMPTQERIDEALHLVETVTIVPRTRSIFDLLNVRPFHVRTRKALKLVQLERQYLGTILESEFVAPILENPTLNSRYSILRLHNDEAYLHRCLAAGAADLKHRLLFLAESLKFRWHSRKVIRGCDLLWYVSKDEMERTASKYVTDRQRAYLVRNLFEPTDYSTRSLDGATVFYVGALSVPTNYEGLIWYLTEVHPRMLDIPNYSFLVAGRRGNGNIEPLLKAIRNAVRLEFAPDVDNLEGYFSRSAAFVNPIRRGAGTKVKTFDAVVAGMPVVTTSIGAEGTGFQHGTHAIIADTADCFAAGLHRVLLDKDVGRSLVSNAQELLRHQNQPNEMLSILESIR